MSTSIQSIQCPNCAKTFKVAPNSSGKHLRCPKCHEIIDPEPGWLAYKWVIVGAGAGVVLCAVLLYTLFGGRDYAAGGGKPKPPENLKERNRKAELRQRDPLARHRLTHPVEPV